jgi:hypothetical protein
MLRRIYRRLDDLQRGFWYRVVASVVMLAISGAVFGSLLTTVIRLDAQRTKLIEAMEGQSLASQDEHAVSLLETGTITVDGRTYGNARFTERPDLIFEENGDLAVTGALADALLLDQYPDWAPRWLVDQPATNALLAVVFTAWLLLIVWLGVSLPFVLTLTATGLAILVVSGSEQAMFACAGIGLLTFTFVLLMRAVQILLDRPVQVLAFAHTVVKEAARSKISLVFIVLILIMLPLLPLGLDPDSPLRFRIQTFISRSLGFTFYLAACMTLFLSCATVAFEIRDRQIWQVVTKPVHRLRYLLGKWLGVITVNLVIMVIAAVSIFTFVQFLREQPVARGMAGYEDAQQVRDAVLTARVGTSPVYAELDAAQLRARADEYINRSAELAMVEEVPLDVRRSIQDQIAQAFDMGQRTVPPSGAGRTYHFEGLGRARASGGALTLRYRFHIMRDDEHETFPAVFVINEDPELFYRRTYVPTISHVLSIPSELIREDGTLSITVVNTYEPPPAMRGAGALNFERRDFELLHQVSSFEANFVRAVMIDWIKLSFLAMLGICAATFLSFPVACLTSFTVFLAGTMGPFLASSLTQYYPPAMETIDWSNIGVVIQWAFQSVIRFVAQTIVFLLDAFGEYRPTQSLVEGRLVSWGQVAGSAFKVGVLWCGLALTTGYFVIRGRQLAIYSGHG